MDFDPTTLMLLTGGDMPSPGASAEAMRRFQPARELGLLGQLSGDRVLTPLGQGLETMAQQEAQNDIARQRAQAQQSAFQSLAQHRANMDTTAQTNAETRKAAAKYLQVRNLLQGGKLQQKKDLFGNVSMVPSYDSKTLAQVRDLMTDESTSPAGDATASPLDVPAPTPASAPRPQPKLLKTSRAGAPSPLAPPAPSPVSAPPAAPRAGNAAPQGTPPDANDPISALVSAIKTGKRPPTMKGLNRNVASVVSARLAQDGFDVATAESDWNATQRHLSTLNGQQQERLRQAIDFTNHSLDKIDQLYDAWQKLGPASGFRMFNRASLAAAKQTPGELGAVAQSLEAQINDLTAEMANVYMGGNSPTDHALALAKENLAADWNEETFKKAIQQARANLTLRRNSMLTSPVAGASAGNLYAAKPPVAQGAVSPATQAKPGPQQVKSREEAMALPKGTHFLDPNGVERVR